MRNRIISYIMIFATLLSLAIPTAHAAEYHSESDWEKINLLTAIGIIDKD